MKILYCIAGTYRSGGMERVLTDKVNWLSSRGHELIVATTDQKGRKPFFSFDPSVRIVDLEVGYEETNGEGIVRKALYFPGKLVRHFFRLKSLLQKENPDVLVSMFCNDVLIIPFIRFGGRKILEVHFSRYKRLQYGRSGIWKMADKFLSYIDGKIVSRYDRFVVLTKEDRGYWGENGNICVISNFRTFSTPQPSSLQKPIAIAVGRYMYQKGFDILIDSWALVARKHPEWHLKIIGDGPLKKELQAQIIRLGLGNCVDLCPPTSQIIDEYCGASMYLMTSRYEGMPMVLLEAQAAGLPVVSFTCKCGPKDVIEDGVSGFLVDEDDKETFAKRVSSLMDDPELRYRFGRAALENSESFAKEHIMKQWETLFNEVCHERS